MFVDASPPTSDKPTVVGDIDFGALFARIAYAVEKVGAKRVALDSLGAISSRFTQTDLVRAELFRIATALKQMGVTAVLTAERWRSPDAADALTFFKVISPHGVGVSWPSCATLPMTMDECNSCPRCPSDHLCDSARACLQVDVLAPS